MGALPRPIPASSRLAASPCIFPSAGPGKPSSIAPWPDCEPFPFQPDGAVGVRPAHRATQWLSRRPLPAQFASVTSCYRLADFACRCHCRPPPPHWRGHRALPSTPSIGIGPGPFAFPYSSSLVSTPAPHPFGGFGFRKSCWLMLNGRRGMTLRRVLLMLAVARHQSLGLKTVVVILEIPTKTAQNAETKSVNFLTDSSSRSGGPRVSQFSRRS